MNTNMLDNNSQVAIKAERGQENQKTNLLVSPPRKRVPIDDGRRQLVFAPLAWLKLRFLLHAGETEVGAFGIASEHDLLYVEHLAVPMQHTSEVSVEFEDSAVADHFDGCFDRGDCARPLWADLDSQPSRLLSRAEHHRRADVCAGVWRL